MKTLVHNFIQELGTEYARATDKFPSSNCATIALMEEVGELAQALLHYHLENKGSKEAIRKEAVQVAVMAMRIYAENDPSIHHQEDDVGLHIDTHKAYRS